MAGNTFITAAAMRDFTSTLATREDPVTDDEVAHLVAQIRENGISYDPGGEGQRALGELRAAIANSASVSQFKDPKGRDALRTFLKLFPADGNPAARTFNEAVQAFEESTNWTPAQANFAVGRLWDAVTSGGPLNEPQRDRLNALLKKFPPRTPGNGPLITLGIQNILNTADTMPLLKAEADQARASIPNPA